MTVSASSSSSLTSPASGDNGHDATAQQQQQQQMAAAAAAAGHKLEHAAQPMPLPPSLILPPSSLHLSAASTSPSVGSYPHSTVSAPASMPSLSSSHHRLESSVSASASSAQLYHAWDPHSLQSLAQQQQQQQQQQPASLPHPAPALAHAHSQPLPLPPHYYPSHLIGQQPAAQPPPPPPPASVLNSYRPAMQPHFAHQSGPGSQHSTPGIAYPNLQQQQQSPQHTGGAGMAGLVHQQAAAGPAAARHSFPPPPASLHHAAAASGGAYSSFYHPQQQQQQHSFNSALQSLPMLSNSFMQASQQQQQQQHIIKQQQQHQAQQQANTAAATAPTPFSPTSLAHLSGQLSLSLGASFPTSSSSSGAAVSASSAAATATTLSGDLLYINQRYHELLYRVSSALRRLDEHQHQQHQQSLLVDDVLRTVREEINVYSAQQLSRVSNIKPEHLLQSPLSSQLSSLSSLSAPFLSTTSSSSAHSDRLFCKPSRLISQFNKKPFKLLMVQIQRQYTSSKRELDQMKERDKEKLIAVRVRLMGAPLRGHVYVVAKDLCQLIHSRKGNVAKSVSQFNEHEKARMPVLCPRSNGTLSTHSLTVLSVDGVKRLLTASRSPLAPHLLKWMLGQVELIVEQGERGDDKVGDTTTVTFPKVERKGDVEVREGQLDQDVQLLADSDDDGGDDEHGERLPAEHAGD